MFFLPRRQGIGVVELSGMIGTTIRPQVYAPILDSLRRDPRFRAVVVDIDSPGGTVPGSDFLYHSLARVAEAKPVVAFVRGMGASGAYLLACAASRIVALPMAMVGSIGVIYMRPILSDLLDKLGVSVSIYKGGRLKDMYGFWRQPTEEEEGKFQEMIKDSYDRFVEVVARGRKLDQARVREYATGELFTARRAKEMGLVDELGDLDRALDLASELGKVRRNPIWVRPKRSFAERLAERFAMVMANAVAGQVERVLVGGLMYVAPAQYPKEGPA